MKIAPVVFALISIGLCLATYAQDRPSQGSKSPSHGTKSRESPTRVNQPTPQHQNSVRHPGSITDQQPIYFTEGIGVCLIGDTYEYKTDPADVDRCDAIIWVNAVNWAVNQRVLIDESVLAGEEVASDGSTACRSCTGTCQTVALPIKDSTYEDVEADSGLSPTECLGNIKAICESGSYRHFATARCGN